MQTLPSRDRSTIIASRIIRTKCVLTVNMQVCNIFIKLLRIVEEVCCGPSDLQSEGVVLIEELSLTSTVIVRASGTISLMQYP